MNLNDKDDLYCALVCALTHDLDVCNSCGKCGNGMEARLNIIKELAKYMNKELPWEETDND